MTWIAIALGAIPGAAAYTFGWHWWVGPIAYGMGIFIGRLTQRQEFRVLIEKARRLP